MIANDIIKYEQLLNRLDKINQDFGLKIKLIPYSQLMSLENKVKCDLTQIVYQSENLYEVINFVNGMEFGLQIKNKGEYNATI